MTLEELISKGEEVTSFKLSLWSNVGVGGYIMIGAMLLILALIVFTFIFDEEYGLAFTSALVISFVFFVIICIFYLREEPVPEYDKWESDAHHFIENLPIEKYEIVYIKIDPEMTSSTNGVFFLGSGGIRTRIERATPVAVAYKDGDEVFVETFWASTNMKLSEDDTPYLTFQNLPKPLGHGIKSGWYNPVVHLPRNYEFTDIK